MKNYLIFTFCLIYVHSSHSQIFSNRENDDAANKIAGNLRNAGVTWPDGGGPVSFTLPKGKSLSVDWHWSGSGGKKVFIYVDVFKDKPNPNIAEEEYEFGKFYKQWSYPAQKVDVTIKIFVWYYNNNNRKDLKECPIKYKLEGNQFLIAADDKNNGKADASIFNHGVGVFSWR